MYVIHIFILSLPNAFMSSMSSRYLESTFSSFTCIGSKYVITRNDSTIMSSRFQRWIQWRQNLPSLCKVNNVETSTQYGFGLGASLAESIRKMVATIELGKSVHVPISHSDVLNLHLLITFRSNISSVYHVVVVRRSASGKLFRGLQEHRLLHTSNQSMSARKRWFIFYSSLPLRCIACCSLQIQRKRSVLGQSESRHLHNGRHVLQAHHLGAGTAIFLPPATYSANSCGSPKQSGVSSGAHV